MARTKSLDDEQRASLAARIKRILQEAPRGKLSNADLAEMLAKKIGREKRWTSTVVQHALGGVSSAEFARAVELYTGETMEQWVAAHRQETGGARATQEHEALSALDLVTLEFRAKLLRRGESPHATEATIAAAVARVGQNRGMIAATEAELWKVFDAVDRKLEKPTLRLIQGDKGVDAFDVTQTPDPSEPKR